MFGKKEESQRFKQLFRQSGGLSEMSFYIYRDTETGVNYLFTGAGHSGGLTIQLDKDGKPVITPIVK